MPIPIIRHVLLSATLALLAGCGGGGDGGDIDVPPPEPAVFTLSGTITASSSQAVDSDTNDPSTVAVPNDTVGSAQFIPNPITLGGYVNTPGSGAPGRSQLSGDLDDYYRVHLLAGQTVTMLVADFRTADADLYLYDPQGNLLEFSIASGEIETLVIAQDGDYVVNAYAYDGATNYILAIGAGADTAIPGAGYGEIVPGELVIKYRGDANDSASSQPTPAAVARRMALEQRAEIGRAHV